MTGVESAVASSSTLVVALIDFKEPVDFLVELDRLVALEIVDVTISGVISGTTHCLTESAPYIRSLPDTVNQNTPYG